MTSKQMLARSAAKAAPAPVPPQAPPTHHDHMIRLVEPPAQTGPKLVRGLTEPWLIEQLLLGACPTCSEHVLHLCCNTDTNIHFYICESESQHRWTLVD